MRVTKIVQNKLRYCFKIFLLNPQFIKFDNLPTNMWYLKKSKIYKKVIGIHTTKSVDHVSSSLNLSSRSTNQAVKPSSDG